MQPIEKLGAFYLGKEYDLKTGEITDDLVMYDARDLTTHAVCVGMTGSGKTGLCIDLLEEAAIDNVPALIIDPKGDITNLLLTFPELRPEDFEPWVNVDDARRKNMSVADYARKIADTWRNGLAGWDEGPERIRMLKNSAEFAIYTPGSDAGLPVSILASLHAPALNWDDNEEVLREQIQGTVSALLGLVDIDADPLQSREHILLSNIFEYSWRRGEDLDLAKLITAIQNPPVRKLGVFDVDTFYPEKERFKLAMALNNIMASPSFASWLEGQPLDIASLLHTPSGKPRHSIFYIAHLSDAERMFFVTLLLEQVVTWMRQQSGTTSLRALIYMDEVFGFFPPTANPPSKKPMLTLMKQARAFGVGMMLTTQNPVDLDYKGLSNAGTWFIGKLQTERDKARVLDGLESASSTAGGALKRRELDKLISGLDSRVFLLHNVHEDQPVIYNTRWAMSYLRGPLTRSQVRTLMAERKDKQELESTPAVAPRPAVARDVKPATPAAEPESDLPPGYSTTPPALSPDLPQTFLPLRLSPNRALAALEDELDQRLDAKETNLVYEPALIALGSASFVDRTRKVNETRPAGKLVQANDLGPVIRWEDATSIDFDANDLDRRPEEDAIFGVVPEDLNTLRELKSYGKDFSDWLYHEQRLALLHNPVLKLYSKPGESERDFKVRTQQTAREKRDDEVDKMRKKYRRELDKLETRLKREERELAEDEADYDARKMEELVSGAETVAGLFGIFGRRKRSLSSAATKRRMTARAKADIQESKDEIARFQEEMDEVQQTITEEAERITEEWADTLDQVETYLVKPRRTDIDVDLVALAWLPYWEISYESARGRLTHDRIPAWE